MPQFVLHLTAAEQAAVGAVSHGESVLKFGVSFPVYVVALVSWVGWFLFVIFGGIGLAAVRVARTARAFRARARARAPVEGCCRRCRAVAHTHTSAQEVYDATYAAVYEAALAARVQ